MTTDPVQHVLKKLDDVRATGEEKWQARCPAHDDQRPSLSISVGDNACVLLHCHAGCSIDAICTALGITKADLFPASTKRKPQRKTNRRIVAVYRYTDEEGNLLFEAVREKPKKFWQRRPDGKGGYHCNLGGVRRVLYRLPELCKSDPQEPVFIVEGERDVDRLRSIGFVATTNPQGAGKWRNEYSDTLQGRRIIILPDNDPPGREHAEKVARSLHGKATKVQIISLPDVPLKGDVSDWLDNGGTREQLLALVLESPEWEPSERSDPAAPHSASSSEIPYRATDAGIVWLKPTHDGDARIPLTNFTARIVADITHDDGVESRQSFEIEARLLGRPCRFSVPANKFSNLGWAIEHLGARAMVYPGFTAKDHARAAIQMLSTDVVQRRVYAHLGWRKIGNGWMYLHAAGAIGRDGQDGQVQSTDIDVPDALSRFALPNPPMGDDLKAAIRTSLGVLDVVPDAIGIVLLGLVYRAVLGTCPITVHLTGQTGTGKTEIAALGQQHFGSELDARHLPASWASTGNANEGIAFVAKDAVLVVDDFAPAGSQYDIQRYHREGDRLIRAQGNRSGRQRMRSDSSLRAHKPPRGVILSTGEDVPRGHSIRARMLIVEVGPKDTRWDLLTEHQRDAARGLYSEAMAGFVRWLAARYEETRDGLRAELMDLRQRAFQSGQHRRTPDIIANLALGLRYLLRFAEHAGAITSTEAGELWQRGWQALGQVAEAQEAHHRAADPVVRFLQLLASAIASGRAHVADRNGKEPTTPERWGWREQVVGTRQYERTEWRPQGDRVGWIDGDGLFLDPDAAYRVAQQNSAGDGIPVGARTLRKRMAERGVLRSTEQGRRETLTIRRMLEGLRRSVLHLDSGALMCALPDQPDQPDHDPRSRPPNDDSWSGKRSGSKAPSGITRPQELTTTRLDAPESPVSATDGRVGQVGQVSAPYKGRDCAPGRLFAPTETGENSNWATER